MPVHMPKLGRALVPSACIACTMPFSHTQYSPFRSAPYTPLLASGPPAPAAAGPTAAQVADAMDTSEGAPASGADAAAAGGGGRVVETPTSVRPLSFKSLVGKGHPEFSSARQQVRGGCCICGCRWTCGWGVDEVWTVAQGRDSANLLCCAFPAPQRRPKVPWLSVSSTQLVSQHLRYGFQNPLTLAPLPCHTRL
jgi:hypothetical protein